MEKKHICFVDYDMSDWGGVEQVIENLAFGLKEDYRVSIVSLCTGFTKLYKDISCFTIIEKRARMREILVKGCGKLIKVLNNNEIDVVIVCGTCAGLIVTLLKPSIKAKIIFADHLAMMSEWDDKPIRLMRYFNSKVSDYTVTLTERSKLDYIERFHISEKKIGYIYNWIDPKVYEYAGRYQCDSKKIITVGRLEYQKGYDRLIEIAKLVFVKYPDWQWHVYGSGQLEDELRQQVENNGLEGNLIFKGKSKHVLEEYKNHSIFVLTSYFEGLPLVLLEAKANNIPVVSFDILTGPSEIIRDGIDGFLVSNDNIEEMVQKIGLLIENAELRSSFSLHAHENLDKFDKNSILSQWKKLIEQI